ncbi:hypothetical protein MMC13_004444 [Lambiella insularis]|nr:hypothetical protein [Lambiella insularis]
MEVLHEAPSTSSFTPLSEHQSQTPSSYYSSTPVLHHQSFATKLIVSEYEDFPSSPLFKLADATSTKSAVTNGDTDHDTPDEVVVDGVDIWVTSEKFILYRPALRVGVSIPYPSISLHAIQSHASTTSGSSPTQALYMQLDTSDGFDDHNPAATVAITVIPSVPTTAPPPNAASSSQSLDHEPTAPAPAESAVSPVQTLFAALSACANLHPDPSSPQPEDVMDEGQDSGMDMYQSTDAGAGAASGLPPPMPGSGGWITAENVGDYFDEEGNWRGGELGAGAGSVRAREEEDGDGGAMRDSGGNGLDGEDDEEAKRRRLE